MVATPDHESAAALDKLFELAVRLTEVMQQGLGERALTPARAEVLLVLDQAGPMVQRDLGNVLRCTPRNVTTLVDALESQGLVNRSPHPTDRRATLVSLTQQGRAATARMGSERQEAAGWLLGGVSREDLARFVAVADQVLDRIGQADLSSRGEPATKDAPKRARSRSAPKEPGEKEGR